MGEQTGALRLHNQKSAESAPGTDASGDLLADGVMDVNTTAAFLGLSRVKVYALMKDGRLAWTQIDGKRLIPKRSAMALARERLIVNGHPVGAAVAA